MHTQSAELRVEHIAVRGVETVEQLGGRELEWRRELRRRRRRGVVVAAPRLTSPVPAA